MQKLVLSLCVALAGSLAACSKKTPATEGVAPSAAAVDTPKASAAAEGMFALKPPRIGGTVIAVGDHMVELKLFRSGLIEGLVITPSGEVVSDGALSVTAATEGGGKEETKLAFSKPQGRFAGRCKGKLVPGRADVSLDAKSKAQTATVNETVVVQGPELGGDVLVAGAHSAEAFVRPSGEVFAFLRDRAGAEVKGDANLEVIATAATSADASEEVSLAFEAPRGCFAGKAKGKLVAGPLELRIKPKGADHTFGRIENVSVVADAKHGGEVLVAGDFSGEVVLDGKAKSIAVFVLDASGKASADANLDVKVGFDADAAPAISLAWDAKKLCYMGSLSGEADFDVKPIRLEIAAAGRAFVASAASLRAVADARLKAAAKVDADADLKARAKLDADAKANVKGGAKANVSAPAATAKVSVAAPKVNVDEKASAQAKAGVKAGGDAKASAKAKGTIKVGF
jgi:hypothetical protein